jgi:putative endonuclease
LCLLPALTAGAAPENSNVNTDAVGSRPMAWFVYVVRCGDGSLYTGISNDVEARVAVHNQGHGARYTRSRRPVTLLYVERRRSRSTAQRREAAIKALPRAQKWALVRKPAAILAPSQRAPARLAQRP